MAHLDKSVAIVGAGDYIGSAIAKKFASEGIWSWQAGAMATSLSLWSPR